MDTRLELAEEVLCQAQEKDARERRIIDMLASGATLAEMRQVLPLSKW